MTIERETTAGAVPAPADPESATSALADWAVGLDPDGIGIDLHQVVRDRLLDYGANLLGGMGRPSGHPGGTLRERIPRSATAAGRIVDGARDGRPGIRNRRPRPGER